MFFFKLFISTLILYLCLDLLWLGVFAKPVYVDALGPLLKKPVWIAGLIVYLLIVFGILVFVLPRVGDSYLNALLWGGMFGFIVYGVYNFTNYAVITHYPLNISLIDLSWGTALCSITSAFAVFMQRLLS